MFIVTPKGNYVPVENIDIVGPSAKGSTVVLRSGKTFTDPRTPSELIQGLVQKGDTEVAIKSIFKALDKMQTELALTTTKLTAQLDVARVEVAEVTAKVSHQTNRLNQVTESVSDSKDSLRTTTTKIKGVVGTLEVAITAEV